MDIRAERTDSDIQLWLDANPIFIPVGSAPEMIEELSKTEGRGATALGDLRGLASATRLRVIQALQDALD